MQTLADWPSRLRHRITLESRVLVKNENGQFTESWRKESILWAAIEPIAGRGGESLLAGQLVALPLYRFTLRAISCKGLKLTTDMRIILKGRRFDITHIAHPFDESGMIILIAEEQF